MTYIYIFVTRFTSLCQLLDNDIITFIHATGSTPLLWGWFLTAPHTLIPNCHPSCNWISLNGLSGSSPCLIYGPSRISQTLYFLMIVNIFGYEIFQKLFEWFDILRHTWLYHWQLNFGVMIRDHTAELMHKYFICWIQHSFPHRRRGVRSESLLYLLKERIHLSVLCARFIVLTYATQQQ